MPIYEYVCQDCNKKFDALRSMQDADSPIQCSSCRSLNTSRLISKFFAHSNGQILTEGSGGGCSGCQASSCSSCKN